jgi:hypothetical protein
MLALLQWNRRDVAYFTAVDILDIEQFLLNCIEIFHFERTGEMRHTP